ncbi:universal stress protein [Natrinema salsiterrestre]|uniref:Universal stress protein n=1 Tax=Natrinema salsiterrestre TaxID=2950540 RepID=A0A9Q4Q547_9EURY|nr:universal stress protein [Natrinema salsiterrestre]MDF9747843.1 universal stress protein [Natrinema salsiterrestre]
MAIETVLLAVNDEDDRRAERIIDVVLEVAKPVDATVVVAHVIPEDHEELSTSSVPLAGPSASYVLSDDEYADLLGEYPLDEYDVDDVVAKQETVQTVVDRLADADIDHEVRGAVGEPGDGIVALADDVDADRLVVSGRHRSPADKVIFGSVAQAVLIDSPVPVTFVRNN